MCIIDQNINITDATGRLLFNTLSAIAKFEIELRVERQADGTYKVKERGIRFGRQEKLIAWQGKFCPCFVMVSKL